MCGGSRRTGCFAMIWRVSLRFVFWLVPFFSEAGRKSNRDFSISKLLMKTFSFYSAAEADRLQMQWLSEIGKLALQLARITTRVVVFSPFEVF